VINEATPNGVAFLFLTMRFDWKKWVTNKYLIATAAFIALLFLSDRNNIIDQYKLHKQYNKVKTEHDYYIKQIGEAKRQYNELFSDKRNLEKFAREKYLMKRDDEDVFVIVQGKVTDNQDSTENK